MWVPSCYLTGLKDLAHAAYGPMSGAIMETAVLSEIFKTLVHRGVEPQLYFWRTSIGAEVDIVVEHENKLVSVEVKSSSTPVPAMAASLRTFPDDLGKKALPGYLIHAGDISLPLSANVMAIPFALL